MDETVNLGLPKLQPAQAQKHVTVNEALTRLDGVTQMVLVSRNVTVPPAAVADGVVYGVPAGAVNAWAGEDGKLALGANGGWVFLTPRAGWRAWIADEACQAIHDGQDWLCDVVSMTPGGAYTQCRTIEFEHDITPGSDNTLAVDLPAKTVILAITMSVLETVTGTLSGFSVGHDWSTDRYANGLSLNQGAQHMGIRAPGIYFNDQDVQLTAEGGDFAGGKLRVVYHLIHMQPPGGA